MTMGKRGIPCRCLASSSSAVIVLETSRRDTFTVIHRPGRLRAAFTQRVDDKCWGVVTTDVVLVLRLAVTSALRGLSRDDSRRDRFTRGNRRTDLRKTLTRGSSNRGCRNKKKENRRRNSEPDRTNSLLIFNIYLYYRFSFPRDRAA